MYETPFWHLGGTKYRTQKQLCSSILKRMTWNFEFTRKKVQTDSGWPFCSLFLKKVSQGQCFFKVWCTPCTNSLNKAYKKNCVPEFPIFSALKLPSYGLVPSMYLQKLGISKHFWKKIRHMLWTVVTYIFTKKSWTWDWTWCW